MNFDFYIDFWKRAFDFKGRSSREEFWYTYLVNVLISLILTFLLFIPFVAVIQSIWGLAIIIPMLAISVRRLHDSNHSCLPIIIIFIIEVISIGIITFSFIMLIILAFAGENIVLLSVLGLLIPSIAILISAIVQIVYMCLPPTMGINQYGTKREKLNFKKSQYQEQPMNYEYNQQREGMNQEQNNPYFQSYEKTYGKTPDKNNVHLNEQNPV